ncbi:MAG: phosphohexomutase domain-containing protein [bacterium]|jgi:phosphomannomutase
MISASKPISINFGTDGFRGVIGDNFTFNAVSRISFSLAEYLKENSSKTVAIGYDTRFLSKEFASAAANVLTSAGINVILSDNFCPSPVLSYFVKSQKCAAGIMITASHNPFMFNGLKFKSRFGSSMSESDVKKIEKIVNAKSYYVNSSELDYRGNSNFQSADFKKDYIKHIIGLTEIDKAVSGADKDLLKSLDIIIDPMFGAGIGYLSFILKKFSIKHSSIHNTVNPAFPGLNPEPIDGNLRKLKAFLKERGIKNKFAVGFATDGDADRIGAVDSEGNFIDSHKIFSIILNYLIKEGCRGSVVKTVSVSRSIDDICKEHKIKLYETPIGFKNIAALMTKKGNDVFMGGEESGGIGIASHLPERDGIFNALLLLKIMIKTQKSLNELLSGMSNEPYPYSYIREDLHLEEDKKRRLIEKLKDGSFILPLKNDIVSANFTDGFKFEYKDGSWLLIRPSGTEPVLRIYAESRLKKKTDDLINKVKRDIENF